MGALSQSFFVYALLGGGAIALAAGLVGFFLVERAQVFTGDALSHVSFTGAMAALAVGADLRSGLFIGTIAAALLMAALGQRSRLDDVAIGSVFAWVLGLGAFFLGLYTASYATTNASAGTSVLFGSIMGLDPATTVTAVAVGLGASALMLLLARPLLFASVDPAVARARGVPVRLLGYLFLALTGAVAAEATQVVGSLLLLGLIAAPAGAARLLPGGPYRALATSAGLSVAVVWGGLWLSYAAPRLPPSFVIVTLAAACYACSAIRHTLRPAV